MCYHKGISKSNTMFVAKKNGAKMVLPSLPFKRLSTVLSGFDTQYSLPTAIYQDI